MPTIPFAYKLAASVSIVIILSMVFLSSSVIDRQHELIEQQFHHSGMTTVRQLADSAVEPVFTDDQLGLESLVTKLSYLDGILGAAVYDGSGQALVSVGLPAPIDTLERYREHQPSGWRHEVPWSAIDESASNPISFLYPIQFRDVIGGHALVTFSRIDIDRAKEQALWSLIVLALLISVLVVTTIVLVSRHFARPIAELVEATRAIGDGKYGFRIRARHQGEFGALVKSFNAMAEGLQEKLQVESVLSRFVSGRVANSLFGDLDGVQIGGTRVTASVLFVDIVDFTSYSEQHSPEKVAELLNECFGYFAYAAGHYNGIVDKFIGDCGMLVFGVPQPDSDHEFHAVATAVLIQNVLERANVKRLARGDKAVQVRIGISSGSMLAGILGSDDRMQYTVIGDSVNLASRLCGLGFPGQIVVDREFFLRANRNGLIPANDFRTVMVKGKKDPVETVTITGLHATLVPEIEAATEQVLRSR